MLKTYEVQEITLGASTHYRFSLRRESGRTYYSPLFFRTAQEAEDKAQRMSAAELAGK